ncbi:MAG: FAD-binding oxidoreductase [Chloroflexota bacterium]
MRTEGTQRRTNEAELWSAGLSTFVGPAHVRSATLGDAIDGVQPAAVVAPADEREVAAVLAWCTDQDLRVSPRGGGTKSGWGNPPRAVDVVLSLERLNALIEHAAGDMTATVQAGMSMSAFQASLSTRGQMLAMDVGDAERATIGGVIATNDSGALRGRYGGVRDQILGITVVRADGVIAHGGGRVVKNVAGYDLPKLYTGSLGTLGVITQATFRVYPLPPESITVSATVDTCEAGGSLIISMLSATLVPTGLTLLRDPEHGLMVTAQFSGIRESVDAQVELAQQMFRAAGTNPDLRTTNLPSSCSVRSWSASVLLKVSVLPTEIAPTVERAIALGNQREWATEAVIHAHGLGSITWYAGEGHAGMVESIQELRSSLVPRGGTVVVLDAPPDVKRELDVWGPAGDAVPLMRRVKAELDPQATLNPGRLIGGI